MLITTNIPKHNYNQTFKAGNVYVFSDFDRTFMPATQLEFRTGEKSDFLRKYFNEVNDFLKSVKDGLKLGITTGRTFDEYKENVELSQKFGYGMPFPDRLFIKNGADEFLRTQNPDFPFDESITDDIKNLDYKNKTNWPGSEVVINEIKKFCKEKGIKYVFGGSDKGIAEHGEYSLFDGNKLGSEDGAYILGIRKDGNNRVCYTFPIAAKETSIDELKIELEARLQSLFEKNNTKFVRKKIKRLPRIFDIYEPQYFPNGISKIYDTKIAMKKAIEENDLLIIAGDASNDYEMLNPMSYLEGVDPKMSPENFVKELDRNPLLIKKFKDLPYVGVAITEGAEDDGLKELIKYFSNGRYKKIVTIKAGEWVEGIISAIRFHCKQNPDFKKLLSIDIKNLLNLSHKP